MMNNMIINLDVFGAFMKSKIVGKKIWQLGYHYTGTVLENKALEEMNISKTSQMKNAS